MCKYTRHIQYIDIKKGVKDLTCRRFIGQFGKKGTPSLIAPRNVLSVMRLNVC